MPGTVFCSRATMEIFKIKQKLWFLGQGAQSLVGRCHRVGNGASVCTCLEMVSRLPEKVLFEKVTSMLGFEGVSPLSWGRENAFKVKVRNGFNITHRWDREPGLLGEPQGPGSPEGWAPDVRLDSWTRETSQKGHIYFMTKTLSFPKGQWFLKPLKALNKERSGQICQKGPSGLDGA